MNRTMKTGLLKVGALLAALSAGLYAAMTFEPDNQYPLTLGSYALKDTVLEGGTLAYRPWFENAFWTGDVIEYSISATGFRETDATVGSLPATPGSSGGCGETAPGGCWMARATMDTNQTTITDYWKEETTNGRNIFTHVDTDFDGIADSQADFLWNNLSARSDMPAGSEDLAQQHLLDPASASASPALINSYDSPILNFVRGDDSEETANGGNYRNRFSLLGDIIGSWPVYIGPPPESYTLPGFIDFKNANSNRAGRIAVGANDGMLHMLDEDDGSEAWAYVPSMLFDKLSNLTVRPYNNDNHTYFVDGRLTAASAQVSSSWKTVLTGGMGAGAPGLFIIDVTNPDITGNKIMHEITGDDVGHIYGQPSIFRLEDNDWYVVTGNGFGSSNDAAKLLLINLNTGAVTAIGTGQTGGGLASISLVDANRDTRADFAFGGDTNGDMWKFNLTDLTNVTVSRVYDGSPDQPITTRPEIGQHPAGGYMVLWGTGNITSRTDAEDANYPTQAIYGIWDSGPGAQIVTHELTEVSDATFGTETEDIRYIAGTIVSGSVVPFTEPDYTCAANNTSCDIGWKIELPNTGERIVAPLQLRAGRVSVVTINPLVKNEDGNIIGENWLMSLFYLTGGDKDEAVLNLSGDDALDSADFYDINGDGSALVPPVALGMGNGNLSQPAIASIEAGTDAMFINGLSLRFPVDDPPEGPLLFGHIDVEVDSPSGGNIAPNVIKKHSEGYNITLNDGIGRAVDGHFHAYDTSNLISYVDLFQLEPRRGLSDAAAASSIGTPPCSNVINEREIEVTIDVTDDAGNTVSRSACIPAVEGELNRAYDTLQTDRNGVAEAGAVESEVYAEGTSTPLGNTERFIVTLANADLTSAATLQIGCRTWNVHEYQEMLTAQLEAGTAPGALVDCPDNPDGSASCPSSTHSVGGSDLVFTLDGIASDNAHTCPASSPDPTLRVSFQTTDILTQGILGTRSQCVLGLHDYHDPVDHWDAAVLCYAPKHLGDDGQGNGLTYNCSGLTDPLGNPLIDPGSSYIQDPALNRHITKLPSREGTGYRWRNGALTVQLLSVEDGDGDGSPDFVLQDNNLPADSNGNRIGGIYAKAFDGLTRDRGRDYPDPATFPAPGSNGLLYEATMYWHLGDLSDGIQRGDPAAVPCYGDANWNSIWSQETRGLTLGQYNALFGDVLEDVLAAYDGIIGELDAALESGDEAAINAALLKLAELLELNPELLDYHNYRDYAPGVIPEQHLRDIDKNLAGGGDNGGGDSPDDWNPGDDLTSDGKLDEEGLGPNFVVGRRTWIDIRQ